MWSNYTQYSVFFYQKYFQSSTKYTNFRPQICPGNVTLCHEDRHPLMLECFLTSLRCIRMITKASDMILDPIILNTMSFLPKLLSIFKRNYQFGAPDLPRKWYTVLHGRTSVAVWLIPNLLLMYRNDWKSLWYDSQSNYSQYSVFSTKNNLQFQRTTPILGTRSA